MSEDKYFKTTHRVAVKVGADRFFELSRGEHGSYLLEWHRPSADAGSAAVLTTKVMMTEESFLATLKGGLEMMKQTGDLDSELLDDDHSTDDSVEYVDQDHASDQSYKDHRDAERYRKWRDGACYRQSEIAKALAPCITPNQIDEALDRLP